MTLRHDWYQTQSHVFITIFVKSPKDSVINISERSVSVSVNENELAFNMYQPIDPEQSSYVEKPTKIEIKLFKRLFDQWPHLEQEVVAATATTTATTAAAAASASAAAPAKSAIKPQDWDKITQDLLKNEEADKGEQALQTLLQQIYGSGNENVRKAMNKSFTESGGTVLSTNWKEVGSDKVEVKPPSGTEFKKWV